jgi:hypothetical protein
MPWLFQAAWTHRSMLNLGPTGTSSPSQAHREQELKHDIQEVRKCHSISAKTEIYGTLCWEIWDVSYTCP